ncbi:MAG: hypothetical protein M0042_14305 [Nitrospiraceae bacterium]|nr:hypothetical protein [Nitrospiraceae bacterium]
MPKKGDEVGRHTKTLQWLLLGGAVYFLAIAAVHMLRIKVPFLFFYFSIPSYGYQDRIISFLAFGWSVFLFTAAKDPVKNNDLVKAILVAGVGALFGLHVINTVTDFRALSPAVHPRVFRIESGVVTLYVIALLVFYFFSRKEEFRK